MANLIMLIVLAMRRDEIISTLTHHGQRKILIERATTSKLRAQLIDLVLAASTDDTTD